MSLGIDAPMRISEDAARLRADRVSPCRLWRGGLPSPAPLDDAPIVWSVAGPAAADVAPNVVFDPLPPALADSAANAAASSGGMCVTDTNSFSSTDPRSAVSRR